jgi:hypothetical protein
MAYDAGEAFLRITPDFRGVVESITAQAAKWAKPAADAFNKVWNDTVRGGLGIPGDTTFTRQGAESGGAFADAFKARVEAALKSLPDAKIDGDTSEADLKIAGLRTQLEGLRSLRIGVDIDAAAAQAKLAAIAVELKALGAQSPDIRVKVDTAAATAELVKFESEIDGVSDGFTLADHASSALSMSLIAVAPAVVPIGAAFVAAFAGSAALLGAVAGGLGVVALGAKSVAAAVSDEVEPAFRGLQDTAAQGLLPGVDAGIRSLLTHAPELDSFVGSLSKDLGGLAAAASAALTGPYWQQFYRFIEAEAGPVLNEFGQTLGNVAHGAAGLVEAFKPVTDEIGAGLEHLSADFAAFGGGAGSNSSFQAFLTYIETEGPVVVHTIGDLAAAGAHLAAAIGPLGGITLQLVDDLAKLASEIPTPLILAAAAAFESYKIGALAAAAASKTFGAALAAQKAAGAITAEQATASAASFSTLASKGGLVVGTLAGIALGAKALGDEFNKTVSPSVAQFTSLLLAMNKAGSSSALTTKFLQELTLVAQTGFGFAAKFVTNLDQSLANLVAGGHAKLAADQFAQYKAALEAGGQSVAKITSEFPAYNDALLQSANNAKLAALGTDQFGDAAAAAAAKMTAAAQETAKAALSLAKFNEKIATDEAVAALSVHLATAIRLYTSTAAAVDQVTKQVETAITNSVKITATGTTQIAALLAAAQNKAATTDFNALMSHQNSLDATAYAKSLQSVADAADSLASKAKTLADAMAADNDAEKQARASAEATAAALAERAQADDAAATAAEQAAAKSSDAYKTLAAAATAATQEATQAAQALVANLQSGEQKILQQIATFQSSIASSLTQGTDLASIWQSLVGTDADGNPIDPTLGQVQKTLDATLAQVQGFTKDLTAIANEGGSQDLITQILGLGDASGDALAKQLLAAGASTIKGFSNTYAQLDSLADAEGARLAKSFYGDGVSSMEQLIKGLVSKFPDLTAALQPLIEALRAAFTITPIIGATVTSSKSTKGNGSGNALPGFASGVQNFSGGLAVVGEQGPELLNLPPGSDVIPNSALRSLSLGGLQPVLSTATLSGASGGSAASFVGDLYLDSGEFLGVVRGQATQVLDSRVSRAQRRADAGAAGGAITKLTR